MGDGDKIDDILEQMESEEVDRYEEMGEGDTKEV